MEAKGISPGHYERKQLRSKSLVIRFSHRGRFMLARRLIQPFAGQRLLDYGCGDATFVVQVCDLFPSAAAFDNNPGQLADCRRRLANLPDIHFYDTLELRAHEHDRSFDVITCMEVLEHCVEADAIAVLDELRRLVSPAGTVVISVPIEIGPSLLFKQAIRICAGWRRLGDYEYTERYGFGELCRMVFAGRQTRIVRPVYSKGEAESAFHGHKGFNWRTLRDLVRERFEIRDTCFSPLAVVGNVLNSQVWFVCGAKVNSTDMDIARVS